MFLFIICCLFHREWLEALGKAKGLQPPPQQPQGQPPGAPPAQGVGQPQPGQPPPPGFISQGMKNLL